MKKENVIKWLRQCSDVDQDALCEDCPYTNCEDCAGALMQDAAVILSVEEG